MDPKAKMLMGLYPMLMESTRSSRVDEEMLKVVWLVPIVTDPSHLSRSAVTTMELMTA